MAIAIGMNSGDANVVDCASPPGTMAEKRLCSDGHANQAATPASANANTAATP